MTGVLEFPNFKFKINNHQNPFINNNSIQNNNPFLNPFINNSNNNQINNVINQRNANNQIQNHNNLSLDRNRLMTIYINNPNILRRIEANRINN